MASVGLIGRINTSVVEFPVARPRRSCVFSRNRVGFRVFAQADAEPDLSVTVNGLKMPNPFVIGSGPPGTNYTVMKRAFDEGWGAVIAKTVSLDAAKVVNVTPRYARLRAGANGSARGQIIGWENIELISDRPLETMLKEFKQLKEEYPDRILIASIMEEYNKPAWEELIDRVEQTGIDAIEINFSCPHGMPERKMGAAVGQDCALLEEVCGWINAKATVPVWAKMTPNITDITQPARVSLQTGCEGVSAINTIMSVMGINLDTLRPEPCVEGYSTPGGYSSKAVHPIALAKVMSIARMMKNEFGDKDYSLSAIGGLHWRYDAWIRPCKAALLRAEGFHEKAQFFIHRRFQGNFTRLFHDSYGFGEKTTRSHSREKGHQERLQSDKDWTGDGFVKETESMVSN
ncbi:UNVERIFIED_CONTAM: Dihydropyrimidine dehydrogenase (NADP(+)), chloroplastic [Sesamum angustifolium]|uniref:dihydropyrimidine dehydrogenase (NADP(+)) n=1 Tax=Sesamum angustifolium TaxID=2727405 RepID=A0AAW2RJQ7_9LAMI